MKYEGEGIFVKVTVATLTGETATSVFYVEAKDPPYPGRDCPVQLAGGSSGTINGMVLSPNPSSGKTRVVYRVEKAGQVSLALFDFSGSQKEVIEQGWKEEGAHETSLDMGAYRPGVYFVRCRTENGVVSQKMAKID